LVAMSVTHAVIEGGVVGFDAWLAVAAEEMVASREFECVAEHVNLRRRLEISDASPVTLHLLDESHRRLIEPMCLGSMLRTDSTLQPGAELTTVEVVNGSEADRAIRVCCLHSLDGRRDPLLAKSITVRDYGS
jgi:hypothetical protein